MHKGLRWWKDVSISKKLYLIIGVMAFLIAGELLTLRFAICNLSAARAFVGGESSWSKAQKNAAFSLQRFAVTKNEKDYNDFCDYLEVPKGDHRARIELLKPNPDMRVIREGFSAGHIHPEDIEPIVNLLRQFYWVIYISQAIETWAKGDAMLFQLEEAGDTYHSAIRSDDTVKAEEILVRVKKLNEDLTILQDEFSYVLGEGSRWLESLVLSILTIAVLTVESIGLTLAYFISRGLSRGLSELNEAAQRIGRGDLANVIPVHSRDEIGQLADAVNTMGRLLRQSYNELETRVQERTAEARSAVEARDEFLSIASHELKMPLTALFLQLQILLREVRALPPAAEVKRIERMSQASMLQSQKISALLNELLDLTRIKIGKFEIHKQKCNPTITVRSVVSQLRAQAAASGSVIELKENYEVRGFFDEIRISQLITNLLTNAIKFGNGKPITVIVENTKGLFVLKVADHGKGIPIEQRKHIFERFERGAADPRVSGLGLGLYISNQIVNAHGGTISVESSSGEGSVFTVQIPIAS
jgi:two-component system, sensor histidine kinase